MTEPTPIDLDSLDEVVELTTALVEAYREAARVMLDRFYDDDDRLNAVIIRNDEEIAALLLWQKPTEQMRNSYDNLRDATEYGAYAVAFAVVYAADEYVVKKRAHHGSGSDFLMVEEGETDEQFVRLEVSGVGQGESRLVSRLRNKVRQLEEGNLRRPGVAAVVGFEAATVLLEDCPL